MEPILAAIQIGDYAGALAAVPEVADLDPAARCAITALLLAMLERFDDADRALAGGDAANFKVVIDGERQRATRWRDPEANGTLNAAAGNPQVPLHVAIACAFVRGNDDLATRAMAQLAEATPLVGGTLHFVDGQSRTFRDILDADDSIGQMLETYCGDGLVYFPFSCLHRIEILPRANFLDHLLPKARLTTDEGIANAYVPLLYAGSATSDDPSIRTGALTLFDYLGPARRCRGQRDFLVDGSAMIGLQHIAAIDFARPAAQDPAPDPAPATG
jgi:protein involved in temperature-dependent protein secretion